MPQPALSDELCAETLALLDKHDGNVTLAAIEAGVARNTFNSRVNTARARSTGMIVTGRSTLRNAEGETVMEWEKTSLDQQKAAEARQAAFEAMSAILPRAFPVAAPAAVNGDLATVYTLTDCHVGALAWHREGGADWDLQIAEDTLVGCFEHMIAGSPQSELGVVNQLGDFLHFDGLSGASRKSWAWQSASCAASSASHSRSMAACMSSWRKAITISAPPCGYAPCSPRYTRMSRA